MATIRAKLIHLLGWKFDVGWNPLGVLFFIKSPVNHQGFGDKLGFKSMSHSYRILCLR